MRKLQFFIHWILLVTTPTLFAYPHIKSQTVNYGYSQEIIEWSHPNTYDEIMQMLEDLESGELEKKYSPTQLEKVNGYLAILAKEGVLPNELEEEMSVEEDTYDLMYGKDSAFDLTCYLKNSNQYKIIPAVFNGYSDYSIVQCGEISRAWKKTKKFFKKHKKAIIIGAVVVVAATVVVVAVVAASSAGAATAVAGAASSAGSGSISSDSSNSESKEKSHPVAATPKETPSLVIDSNEAPVMKAAIDEHVSSFKEFLVEDKAAQKAISPKEWDDLSFGEKTRELGAYLAHQAYDEIIELVQVVPQLCEEVKEMGSKFVPKSLYPHNNEPSGSPTENYENLVAKGHKVIDKVFSTDQSELFTAESKENDLMNNFAIAMLPLPGSFNKAFPNITQFKKAGMVLDRSGFTKAGRGLMKHGYREGSVFPNPIGNPGRVNKHGQQVLENILNHPEKKVVQYTNKLHGSVIEIEAPKLGGVRFNGDGTEMMGFLEPKWFK